MTGMDAVALLGNLGLRVKIIGIGKVKNQSVLPGNRIKKNTLITLELS
jgi:cell division protein FtsI (penicillin-binding protein 3)